MVPKRLHPIIAIAVISTVISTAFVSRALASGPSDQTLTPQDNRVVRVLVDFGLPGGEGFMEGTGSVIGNTNVGGQGYLWVLTADHVVSSTSSHGGALANGIGI